MTTIIDRRSSSQGKGMIGSRQRFISRNKGQIKKAVERALDSGNVTDIGKGGADVTVPKRDLHQPHIHHDKGGVYDHVLPGNKEFVPGDRLPKSGGGSGSGREGSPDGESEDDFAFHLDEREFLDILFDGLELPNLVKQGDLDSHKTKPRYAGHVSQGNHAKLDLPVSKKQRLKRMMASQAPYNEKMLRLLDESLSLFTALADQDKTLAAKMNEAAQQEASGIWIPKSARIAQKEERLAQWRDKYGAKLDQQSRALLADHDAALEGLKAQRSAIPMWNETTDLRFRHYEPEPVPTSKAVMFCLMDVSASMDQDMKNHAKLFYFLLHRFLQRHYEKTDVVFIRHHAVADEVSEQDFFYEKVSGGTVVSTALDKMIEITQERYPLHEWNIYGAQASDGDNTLKDNATSVERLREILGFSQGYFYTEIVQPIYGEFGTNALWQAYESVEEDFSEKFWMGRIKDRKDIWPVFREFFQKRESYDMPGSAASAYYNPQQAASLAQLKL